METFRDLNMVKRLVREVEGYAGREEIITADRRIKKLLEIVPTIAQSVRAFRLRIPLKLNARSGEVERAFRRC